MHTVITTNRNLTKYVHLPGSTKYAVFKKMAEMVTTLLIE
jgi:hypothetical protein